MRLANPRPIPKARELLGWLPDEPLPGNLVGQVNVEAPRDQQDLGQHVGQLRTEVTLELCAGTALVTRLTSAGEVRLRQLPYFLVELQHEPVVIPVNVVALRVKRRDLLNLVPQLIDPHHRSVPPPRSHTDQTPLCLSGSGSAIESRKS